MLKNTLKQVCFGFSSERLLSVNKNGGCYVKHTFKHKRCFDVQLNLHYVSLEMGPNQ